MSDYYSASQNDSIELEPRLLEYLNKKKNYKRNGVMVENLEKSYQISEQDKFQIKSYLNRDKKGYNLRHQDFVDPTKSMFESDIPKTDIRLERIKHKQQKDNEANQQRNNYSLISRNYDMYRKTGDFASMRGDDFKDVGEWMNTKDLSDYDDNPYKAPLPQPLGSTFNESNSYKNNMFPHRAPKIKLNHYMPWKDNKEVSDEAYGLNQIMGDLNQYNSRLDRTYQREETRLNRKKNNSYQDLCFEDNFNQKNDSNDIEMDSFLRFGSTPSRGAKSLGYPNSFEHSFSYISNDMQKPEHVVNDRGFASRSLNKEIAKKVRPREILN